MGLNYVALLAKDNKINMGLMNGFRIGQNTASKPRKKDPPGEGRPGLVGLGQAPRPPLKLDLVEMYTRTCIPSQKEAIGRCRINVFKGAVVKAQGRPCVHNMQRDVQID